MCVACPTPPILNAWQFSCFPYFIHIRVTKARCTVPQSMRATWPFGARAVSKRKYTYIVILLSVVIAKAGGRRRMKVYRADCGQCVCVCVLVLCVSHLCASAFEPYARTYAKNPMLFTISIVQIFIILKFYEGSTSGNASCYSRYGAPCFAEHTSPFVDESTNERAGKTHTFNMWIIHSMCLFTTNAT